MAVFVGCAHASAGAPRCASVFGDHMVLQRDMPVPVWGTAEAGAVVEVSFAGRTTQARADANGRWRATLPPLVASERPAMLSVRDDQGAGQNLVDVLVGDVWLCSGQSNMRWTVAQSDGAADLIAAAEIPGLRLLNWMPPERPPVGLDPADYFAGDWAVASGPEASRFSAVAFVFGRELRRSVGVPIGLVLNAVGGAPMVSWLPESVIRSRPEYAVPEGLPWVLSPALQGWVRMASMRDTQMPTPIHAGAEVPSHPFQPGYLYRAGIAPLQPMALRGVTWYQGESDAEYPTPAMGSRLLNDLVDSWRQAFRSHRLPFLMVQLPRIDHPERVQWPVFREIQRRAAQTIPGVHLAVTMDLGVDGANVHPTRKIPVGERLARLARAEIYGEALPAHGPRFVSARAEDGAMCLRFAATGDLRSCDDAPLRGFEVAGRDGRFFPARAVPAGGGIRAESPQVPAPVAARYGWHMNPEVNLSDGSGLPASPFTSVDPEGVFDRPLRIACAGDSITAGTGLDDPAREAYPAILQSRLGPDALVRNFGLRGACVSRSRTTSGGSYRLQAPHAELKGWRPHVVILAIGVNDITYWPQTRSEFETEFERLLRDYLDLPGLQTLLVAAPLPPVMPGQKFHGQPGLAEIDAAILRITQKWNVPTIDLQTPLSRHPEWFPDHLHPSADGARTIAALVEQALRTHHAPLPDPHAIPAKDTSFPLAVTVLRWYIPRSRKFDE